MARSVNKAILVGHCGNEPEIRATASGSRIAKISLATNESWTDRTGEKKEKTEWHRLTFFGKIVDVVEQWVKKGDRLYIEGRIEYSTSEADGVTRYYTDIIVQDMVMLGGAAALPNAATDQPRPSSPGTGMDADLPFAPLRLTEPWA